MRQGEIRRLATIVPSGFSRNAFAREVVLITQTCDLVQDRIPSVQVADVINLVGEVAASALSGKNVRYIPIPGTGPTRFANLDRLSTLSKRRIRGSTVVDSQADFTAHDEWVFGRRFARRFQRFAFPDPVAEFLKPLDEIVRNKYLKPASPLGQAFQQVLDLRIEKLGDWDDRPLSLTLMVVLDGVLFEGVGDEVLVPPSGEFVNNLRETASVVAGRIVSAASDRDRLIEWLDLGRALQGLCIEGLDEKGEVMGQPIELEVDVVLSSELTFDRIRTSVPLDLEFLSFETAA